MFAVIEDGGGWLAEFLLLRARRGVLGMMGQRRLTDPPCPTPPPPLPFRCCVARPASQRCQDLREVRIRQGGGVHRLLLPQRRDAHVDMGHRRLRKFDCTS